MTHMVHCLWLPAVCACTCVCSCVPILAGTICLPVFLPSKRLITQMFPCFAVGSFSHYISNRNISLTLSLASPPSFPPQPWGNVFFVNGRVVSGGVPASVGFLFHLQFDFKQTCLIKLRCIWEDLSFSRSWRAEQRDGLAVTPLQHTPLFCKNKTLILPSASQVSGYVY